MNTPEEGVVSRPIGLFKRAPLNVNLYAPVPLPGVIATEDGFEPTLTVALTVLVALLITETVAEKKLVMYAFVPSGERTTDLGADPTLTVALTVLVAVLMTETVLSLLLAT